MSRERGFDVIDALCLHRRRHENIMTTDKIFFFISYLYLLPIGHLTLDGRNNVVTDHIPFFFQSREEYQEGSLAGVNEPSGNEMAVL